MAAGALCLLLAAGCNRGAKPSRIGKSALDFTVADSGKSVHLAYYRGKVVLVRWWTATGCPYGAATAPALNEFHDRYKGRGLVVIGLYHHKSDAPLDPAAVKRCAEKMGFRFPVAIDPEWKTLRRWWLDGARRRWTLQPGRR